MTGGRKVAARTRQRSGSQPVELVLLLAVAAAPLALAPGLLSDYDVTPKLAVVYLAAAILILLAGRWWPVAAALAQIPAGRMFYSLLIAQAVWLMLSAAFSPDLALAIGGTTLRRLGASTQIVILFLVAVLAAQVSFDRTFVRRLLLAIEFCAAIAGIYGILQYLGWDPLIPAESYTIAVTGGDVVRPPSTLRHAMYFANFLVPAVLMSASLAINEVRVRWRWLHAGVLAIAATALALTGTRSAILGLAVGLAILVVVEARRIGRKRMLAYAAVCALAASTLVGALAFSPRGQSFRLRFAQWLQDSRGGPRLMVWRDSLPLMRDHWLTGIGPETFAGEFRKLQSFELSKAYPDHYHEDPHNIFLTAAIGQGAAGLALLCGLIAIGLVCGYRSIRKGQPEGALVVAAIAAVTITEQFAPITITNLLYFYLMIGVAVGLAAPVGGAASQVALRPMTRTVVGLAAVVVAATAAAYVVPDALFAAAERHISQGDILGARESFQLAVRFPFPSESLELSRQMASAARHLRASWQQEALAAAKEASAEAERSSDQRFSALYQSAALAIVSGDLAGAEAKLRAAVVAAPWWYRAHEMLARVLWLTGRDLEAEREARLAIECAGNRESEVRRAIEGARALSKDRPR